jgi:hypothetical protein
MPEDTLHRRLRGLIGRRFHYAGATWLLVEVLADTDTVVLRSESRQPGPVQTDQYGAPLRRSPETISLPITDEDGGYSAELEALLSGRIG